MFVQSVAERPFGHVPSRAMPLPEVDSPHKPTTAPERSLVQRMEALNRANEIRSQRARLKKDIKAGRAQIQQVLLEPPFYVESAKVIEMLLCVPKYGRVKADRLLRTCKISPSKTVGGLSPRQRSELVGLLTR